MRGYRDLCRTGLLWFAPHCLAVLQGEGLVAEMVTAGSSHTLFVLRGTVLKGTTWPGPYSAQLWVSKCLFHSGMSRQI